ncbi:gluconate 2-dehydrogenase subunit 3 family protein [Aestuariibaculum sediminum]|uniref:Gluconate 2-dehydrogenase subunit 3 family protein n=1 Tax=Aestuariibaculum sediminum TaxID=2770637 RepID=A0A8J6QI57_9FLAO|nr:gluconate 2-dehydrogenase subunit 3 family protein [Aestuariibaculum sediminum]MBD0832509.1 gluconate 2-dehydrogenase subunit 3 family protein [Aestuariibaculum sediminum]
MDRRQSLKTLGLGLGYAIATPTIMQILSSCEAKHRINWKPLFLNEEQAYAIESLANVIVPQGLLPAASTVNTPQFLDLLLKDVINDTEQQTFLKGAEVFSKTFKALTGKSILEGDKFDYTLIVSNYFDVENEEAEQVMTLVNSSPEDSVRNERYYLYSYLLFVRRYTLFAYTSAEALHDEVQKYDPYTPQYNSCMSSDAFFES